ncbi:GNAT family N-acetyltransferase [Prosthecomicrobium hirschii]|uniref:GCN5 family acetyltransferase n=1 Tax=Prosthecodimorpha hirschii TaxID=665126 RepID=A0A0P6VTM5_9HYPH|nr:GNAT family protein [Prosthecomicrobium hirschii]KPL54244.1 GCN5 family acetyltransferase [Prosthecomicrobium hirschii]MCW1840947.1 GNAT family N-acetyltransferase [Prosthecomicrobium hirschii]TPQ49222.1 N-acetyltransferase [Prosthecomicrobium hirschii]
MAFLRASAFEPVPIIRGDGFYLRSPALGDHTAWASLREQSRSFLSPWEPTWPVDDLDKAAFRRRIKRYQQEIRADHGYPFFLFRAHDHALLGGLTLAYIRRGVTQSCSLGYWMGQPHAGRGLMTAAVRAVLPYGFQTLRLHRIEAACLPSNAASIALLEKVGFTREGYARRYLCINGYWQDHLLFAMVDEDWYQTRR